MPLIKVHLSSCRSPLLEQWMLQLFLFSVIMVINHWLSVLNSPPTPYPHCIIVPEYTGIPLPLCKHSTYWSHVGKYTSVIFLFKVSKIQSPYQKKMVQVFLRCPLCTFRLWKTHVLPEECTLEKNTL